MMQLSQRSTRQKKLLKVFCEQKIISSGVDDIDNIDQPELKDIQTLKKAAPKRRSNPGTAGNWKHQKRRGRPSDKTISKL